MVNLFFGCRHRRVTRPITPVHKPNSPPGSTYVVCLDCGQPFHYDLETMRMGTALSKAEASPRPNGFEASY